MMCQNHLTWEFWPPEILSLIFKSLDYRTLLNCVKVNEHWRDIALYTGDKYGQWEQLLHDKVPNNGVSFKQKTKLNGLELYENSLLYSKIHVSSFELYRIYNVASISKINVYRDNLIVISPNEVKYFHIETCKSIRSIQTSCIDYDETDYIILEVKLQDNPNYRNLILNGKSCPSEFECVNQEALVLTDVMHYKLECEFCYILDKRNVIWQHRWNHKSWESNALSRYFGQPNTVQAFTVYKKDVYLLTSNGNVYKADRRMMSLDKFFNVVMPQSGDRQIQFEKVLIELPKYHRLCDEGYFNAMIDGDMWADKSVATLIHGDVVIKAFDDGLVEIILYDNRSAFRRINYRDFNVDRFISLDESTNIVSLNIYEANQYQHLFIATNNCVIDVLVLHCFISYRINYPD